MNVTIKGKTYDVLPLPIKKEWFDMILAGEKKEEYRNISPYYRTRFFKHGMLANAGFDKNGKIPTTGAERYILFRNGYSGSSPCFTAKCVLEAKQGNSEWGAEQGVTYYTLHILQILDNPYEKIYEAQGIPFDEKKGIPVQRK